jgi:DNA processing protein
MTGVPVVACDRCLRRTWLLGRLAAHVDYARERGTRLPLLLALPDDELAAALGEPGLADEAAALDVEPLRERIVAAGLSADCSCGGHYPSALRLLPDRPAVLHSAGDRLGLQLLLEAPRVAIVGARRASAYGLEVARSLGRGLSAAGVTVISGLALGVDSAAHAGALEAEGRTIAVLGAGADRADPPSRRALYARIVASGSVVSEFPPGMRARRWTFPARNRLIAGLAEVVVVIEAGVRSGSLITAAFAGDLGRDVGAVPGRITAPLAAGPNALIAEGAQVVRGAEDVLDLLHGVGERPVVDPEAGLDADARRVLAAIGDGHDSLAALAQAGIPPDTAIGAIAELELAGRLVRGPDGRLLPSSR